MAMAELCGVAPSQLQYLLRGPKGRVVRRVRGSMVDSLNAISYSSVAAASIPDGVYVSGEGARWQLRALTAAGWSMAAVARAAGVNRRTPSMILNGGNTREIIRRKIDDAHRTLRSAPPLATTQPQRSAVGYALAKAAANGWTVYEDEDEDYAYEAGAAA